jgi:hypothetical protein
MPTQQELDKFTPIKLYVALSGCKCTPSGIKDLSGLVTTHNWKMCTMGLAPEQTHSVARDAQAKRRQYGLKHQIASTIHAGMGQDLTGVVTQVSLIDPDYRLWEREQVVVFMSRTHFASQIIFVGDKQDTLEASEEILKSRSQFSKYICYVWNNFPLQVTMKVLSLINMKNILSIQWMWNFQQTL